MNRGIWKDLESSVRNWALDRKSVYVFTGPIYSDKYESIGESEVAVPNHLYKIVFDPERYEAISFIMPNLQLKSSDMPKFIVPIREIEKKTGLNFLNSLACDVQDRIESSQAAELW